MSSYVMKIADALDLLALHGNGVRVDPKRQSWGCFVHVGGLRMSLVAGPTRNVVRQVCVSGGADPGSAALLRAVADQLPVSRHFPEVRLMLGRANSFGGRHGDDPDGELVQGRDPQELVAAVMVYFGRGPGEVYASPRAFFVLEGEDGISRVASGIASNSPLPAMLEARRDPTFDVALRTAKERYGV